MKVYASLSYTPAEVEKGYTDRVLKIDLSDCSIRIEEIPEETRRRYVGGRGYCLNLVFEGTRDRIRFDNPENVLALAGGPFCGETAWVGSGKFIAGTISPLTGTFCDSNVGGSFFPLAKLSGFDAIAVTGKSTANVMVFIDGDLGEVRIQDAPSQHGSLLEADGQLEAWKGDGELRNVAILTTGKGAKTTYFGCLNSIYHDVKRQRCRSKQAGRGGTGTVMADKNLWGMVVRNNRAKGLSNHPADISRLRAAGNQLRKVIREEDPKAMRLYAQGTTALIDMMNAVDCLPVNNYQYGRSDQTPKVSGEVFEKKYFRQGIPDGCFPGCNLACTKGCDSFELSTGPFKGKRVAVDGPEYETAGAVTNLGIFDPDFMMEFAWYCDEYGIDTISAGVTMAFLFEAFDRGFLTTGETGGLSLRWGNREDAAELLHALVSGTGFGLQAGKGTQRVREYIVDQLAARTGQKPDSLREELGKFSMECKGLEFSLYLTKESLAQQGGYGFALKGPQHDESWLIALDQVKGEMPTFDDKARALYWFPLFRTWFNMAGLCKLPWIDVRHPEAKNTLEPAKNLPTVEYYLELVNATLGTNRSLEDLLRESECAYTLHKLINLRQGVGTRANDRIPLRAMAPVFINEFQSRKAHYEKVLEEQAGLEIQGMTDEKKLQALQEFRQSQYEKLCDAVYAEKGYDRHAIPRKSTLLRLDFQESCYQDIVDEAREGIQKDAAAKKAG